MSDGASSEKAKVSMGMRPKRNPDVAEKIGAMTMLFDASAGRLFELNETGKRVWIMCDGKKTVKEIADAIKAEFGDEARNANDEVASFVAKMIEFNLLL
uniref:PqqD family protein n=1 Tax=Candidatus Methanomethylicus mesodigestus TaxID=1867258 RepID=A0A7C3ILZ5_9CREN